MAENDPRAAHFRELLEKSGMSLRRLADDPRVNISKDTVKNWANGARPQRDKEKAYEAALQVLEDAIRTKQSYRQTPGHRTNPLTVKESLAEPQYAVAMEEIEIPVWPALPANEEWGDLGSIVDFIPIPAFLARRKKRPGEKQAPERFLAPIEGVSMAPRLREGDLVLIEADPRPRAGRIVVARSGSKATVKVLRSDGMGGFLLEPINPDSGKVEPLNCELVGFVVGILRNFAHGRGSIEWDDDGIGR